MNLNEINLRMNKIKGWAIDSGLSIYKDFTFPDFKLAIYFVNKVAELAENNEHHPLIIIDYNNVKISLTTHSEKGLSEKDFDLAEKIDKID